MAKYRYRIEGGRYGGELAVGTVTNEFVEYWAPIICLLYTSDAADE